MTRLGEPQKILEVEAPAVPLTIPMQEVEEQELPDESPSEHDGDTPVEKTPVAPGVPDTGV